MRRQLALVMAAWALAAPASIARAAPPAKGGAGTAKAACLAAHEEAQSLRAQKKPHAALEKFVSCSRVECPTVVRKECVEQVALVEKDAPTVALEAHDEAGMSATAVKVSMDGAPLAEKLTGSAVDVEPGEHLFRFERTDGKAIELRVLVVEGDKNKKIVADFAPPPSKVSPPEGPVAPPHERRSVPVSAFVAGGLAVVALGSFTFFAITGKGAENDLASSCNPDCKDDQLKPVKRDYLIADISLGIGVVAAVAALILALPALTDSPKSSASIARSGAPAPWMPRVLVRAP